MLEPRRDAVDETVADLQIWVRLDRLNECPRDTCVYDTLPRPCDARCSLMTRRFFLENLTGLSESWAPSARSGSAPCSRRSFLATPVIGRDSVSGASGTTGRFSPESQLPPPGSVQGAGLYCGLSVAADNGRRAAIQKLREISLPRLVNQLRVGPVTREQALDIRRIRPKSLFNIPG